MTAMNPRTSFESDFKAGSVGPDDKATLYAVNVAEGRIAASRHVVAAAQRHMTDLESGQYMWRPGYQGGHMSMFELLCSSIPVIVKGGRIQPMRLDDWQHFIIGSILGWQCTLADPYERQPGSRRFSWATVMAGKTSGKTQLLGVLDIFMLALDYWQSPDGRQRRLPDAACYAIASNEDQASDLVMRPMANIIRDAELLSDKEKGLGLEIVGGRQPQRIVHPHSRSYLRAGGSRRGGIGKAGLIVQYVHAEELHEWPHSDHLDTLVAGQKSRVQPLVVTSTNAGKGKAGYVWEEYRNAIAATQGQEEFDTHFAFLAEVDEDAPNEKDPTGKTLWFPAREYWIQSVPSINSFADPAYLINRITKAKTEYRRNEVDRLNFGRWGSHTSALLDPYLWDRSMTDSFEAPDRDDGDVFVGIDLGRTQDMSAVCLLFRPRDGPMRATVRYWIAGETVLEQAERLSGDLLDWIADGWVYKSRLPVQDYLDIGHWLADNLQGRDAHICADPRFVDLGMSMWRSHGLPFRYEGEFADGWEIKMWPQNNPHPKPGILSMDLAIEAMVTAITDGDIMIERNPVLDWNMTCVEVRANASDMLSLRRAANKRDSEKIDGVIALVEAAGLEAYSRRKPTADSFYNDAGFSLNQD